MNNNNIIIVIVIIAGLFGFYFLSKKDNAKSNTSNSSSSGAASGNGSLCSKFAGENAWNERKMGDYDWEPGARYLGLEGGSDWGDSGRVTSLMKGWDKFPSSRFMFLFEKEILEALDNMDIPEKHWEVKKGQFC